MADMQASADAAANRNGAADSGADAAIKASEAAARQAKEGVRAAEAIAEKTGEASQAAARANSEIMRTHVETAQQAVRSSMEAGMRGLEGLTQNVNRVFGVTIPNSDLAQQSSQNVQAVSQASTALAKGAQDASRAWFDLTQKAMRANLEALGELARCRSLPEVMSVQSKVLRNSLQQAMESGEAIARASTAAIQEASRAMQASQRG